MLSRKFICATREFANYVDYVPAPYIRKAFSLEAKPAKCTVTITGLGFYDLYINGKKITKGLIAPYISNPDDIVYYDTYDVTELVKSGKNAIGILLGNGMQNAFGGEIWKFEKAVFRGAPKTAFAIEYSDADGNPVVIEADGSEKTAPSPILLDDLRVGCFYDARQEIDGWADAEFDDSAWANVLFADQPRGESKLCGADPIVCVRELRAVEIRKCHMKDYWPRGDVPTESNPFPSTEQEGWLYDFGIATSGIERLKIRGEAGTKVDIQCGEWMHLDGEPDMGNIDFYRPGYAQRDIYVLKGNGEETFEPLFTYHGFRYCFVTGISDEQATPDLLTYLVCQSDLAEIGGFTCSDETANALQRMARNSDLANFFYFPTDCPHREKNGWTGDAQVSAEHILMNLDAEKSYLEWLCNIRKAQRADGALPGIVPTAGWGFSWGNGPGWDAVLFALPYYLYTLRGNKQVIYDNAAAMFRYCQYMSHKRNARGLLAYGLDDWCPITAVKCPLELSDSLLCLEILERASFLFSEIGYKLESDFCDSLYREIRTSIRTYLIDFSTMTARGECQTSQAMAIYFGAFENGEKPEAFRRLLEIVKKADDHMDVGLFGARVLFRVLSDFGEYDLAYKLMTRRDFPSYGNFVEQGMTALPESFTEEDRCPGSYNHHFFGDISAWFIEYVGGIRVNPYRRDPSEVRIQPVFPTALDHAEAFYKTVAGYVRVKWQRTEEGITLTVNADEGVHVEMLLPPGYDFWYGSAYKLESGEYRLFRNTTKRPLS